MGTEKTVLVFSSIFLTYILYGSFVSGILEIAKVDTVNNEKIEKTLAILNEYDQILQTCKSYYLEPNEKKCLQKCMEFQLKDPFITATEEFQEALNFEMACVGIEDEKTKFQWLVTVIMTYWSLKYSGMFVSIYYSQAQKEYEKKNKEPVGTSEGSSTNEDMDSIVKLAQFLAVYGVNKRLKLEPVFEKIWGNKILHDYYGNLKKIQEETFPKLQKTVEKLVLKMTKKFNNKQKKQKPKSKAYDHHYKEFEVGVQELDKFFLRVIYESTDSVRPEALSNRKQNVMDIAHQLWNANNEENESKLNKIFRMLEQNYQEKVTTPNNCEYSLAAQEQVDLNAVDKSARYELNLISSEGADTKFKLEKIVF